MKQVDHSRQQLICGDVMEELRKMPDNIFDCIVTSPPYNLGIDYGPKVDDNKSRDDYLEWIKEVFTECKRVLKDEGSLFLNVGYSNRNPWVAMDVAQTLREVYHLQNLITWVKNISIDEKSYGHFKPINSPRFINPTNESIFHFTKTCKVGLDRLAIGVPYEDKSNLRERKKKKNKTGQLKADVRCRGNSWFIKYKTVQSKKQKGKHPASFPVELVTMCLKLGLGDDRKDCFILDPFLGTGTTLVAAKVLGHRGVGIDINPHYIDYASERL